MPCQEKRKKSVNLPQGKGEGGKFSVGHFNMKNGGDNFPKDREVHKLRKRMSGGKRGKGNTRTFEKPITLGGKAIAKFFLGKGTKKEGPLLQCRGGRMRGASTIRIRGEN